MYWALWIPAIRIRSGPFCNHKSQCSYLWVILLDKVLSLGRPILRKHWPAVYATNLQLFPVIDSDLILNVQQSRQDSNCWSFICYASKFIFSCVQMNDTEHIISNWKIKYSTKAWFECSLSVSFRKRSGAWMHQCIALMSQYSGILGKLSLTTYLTALMNWLWKSKCWDSSSGLAAE